MKLEWRKSPYYADTVDCVMESKTGKIYEKLNAAVCRKFKEAEKIADALLDMKDNLKTIYLLGDYDVDGITASLCMSLIFDALGLIYEVYIPRRMSDGYGVSVNSLAKAEKYDIIITIDNGITAKELLDATKKEVYIIDHHKLRKDGLLPDAKVIFNPEIKQENSHYCGAGLVYKIAEYLYQKKILNNTDMRKIAFLCMLGTIADVMPLLDENRTFVNNGLHLLKQGMFFEFTQKAKLPPASATATDIAFGLAPIINACGRLYDSGGQKIYDELYNYITNGNADMLDFFVGINQKRKKMQNYIFDEAWEKYKSMPDMYPNVMLLPNCPEGLIGIIAGKIQERTKKTTIIFTLDHKGTLKGSARGDKTMNVKGFLDEHKELFLNYGGHKSAAGMSMAEENFSKLSDFAKKNVIYTPECYEMYDMSIPFSSLQKIIPDYKKYEPYGEGCRKPVIRTIIDSRVINGKHYRLMGEERSFQLYTQSDIDVIGFHLTEKFRFYDMPKKIEALGTLSESYFKGKIQTVFELIDFKPV